MSYTKQNFSDGQTLHASQLNAMDEQISLSGTPIICTPDNDEFLIRSDTGNPLILADLAECYSRGQLVLLKLVKSGDHLYIPVIPVYDNSYGYILHYPEVFRIRESLDSNEPV